MARRAKIHYAGFSLSAYRKVLKQFEEDYFEAMKRLIRDAAEEFAWRTVQEVAVDTGMSAASLEPLAQELKSTILHDVLPFVKVPERNWGTSMSGRSSKRRIRSIPEGIKAGRRSYKFRYGSKFFPKMTFEFRINVWQYAKWEPIWKSLETGLRYFVKFLDDNYEDYIPEELIKTVNPYTGTR